MPKAKTTRKTKAKNPLTRGRPKKIIVESGSSRNEEPEYPESNVFETSPPATPPGSTTPLPNLRDDVEEVADKQESWEDLPDLVEELRTNDGSFTYITNTMKHREFELAGRKELLQLHEDIDLLKDTVESVVKITRTMCPDSKYGKVSDAIRTLDCPPTFKDLVLKLVGLPSFKGFNPRPHPHLNIPEPVFEESEEEESNQFFSPNGWKNQPKKFPSPAKMAKYTTPKQHFNAGVFEFGTQGRNGGLSTNSKAPRLAKPGEMTYSEGGSPIMSRRIQDDPSKPHERLEYYDAEGKKIEIDIVYRGIPDANKLREFKEFAKDVRGVAATRSTVKPNRIQPPRIIVKTASAPITSSASKKKPEWR